MEHWHTSTAAPYQREPGDLSLASRVLTSSSGNVQTYNPDSKDGIENQDPLGIPRAEPWLKPEVQYPIPKLKLGSNDAHAENLAHLQHRRQNHREKFFRRRRADTERPYLQHPKYLQYRARQRCDTGPDGKPVWDDRIEDAFQNALVNIPPMGRRKKSQRGRPHGRNELISEWIYQETGEYRSRKQVSSHIQVLNTLLKDIPEWAALVTASDDRGGGGSEYYSDSIKDMVRNRSSVSNRMFYRAENRPMPPGGYPPQAAGGYADRHSCSRLSFKMWVSLPDEISQALHLYTRLQSNSSISGPIPLEDVKNWRNSFPNLRSIMDAWTLAESCDIILLDASFQLMADFPPRSSKLGISLELDFMHPSGHNKEALQMLMQWNCVTHIFQHGRLIKETQDAFPANELPPGKVRPFFESKWWASTFTNLTEKRRRAEDSENDAAIEVANEASRNFFKGLTVMQEIWAEQRGTGRRRMGILLWRFSQATPPYVGTTTWQKLIPPSEMAMRPDPAMGDMGLPTLGMDTMMDGTQNPDQMFNNPQGFMPVTDSQYDMFDTNMEELCQDGFMYSQDQLADFSNVHNEGASFAFDPATADLNLSYNLPPQEPQHLPEHGQAVAQAVPTNNIFEMPQLKRQDSERRVDLHTVPSHETFSDGGEKMNGQPLAKFDISTHKVLQAQLAGEQFYHQPTPQAQPSPHPPQVLAPQPIHPHHPAPPPTPINDHDETMRALLAASAMSDLGNTPSHPTPQHAPTPTPTSATSSRAPGPPPSQPSYSHARSHAPQPQPLYIPTTQPPFASHPHAHPHQHQHHHQHPHHHQQTHTPSPHPQSAPLPLSASTTHSMPLSHPHPHPQHPPLPPQHQHTMHPQQQHSHPSSHRPILHSHHSFTAPTATDAPYHHPQAQPPPHHSAYLSQSPHHHQPPHPSLHHPHSHRRVPSKNGFAAALANLDAYAANNGDGDFSLPDGAFDGGAGAVALAAEIARPQSQPVVSSSELGAYDGGARDEWAAGPQSQEVHRGGGGGSVVGQGGQADLQQRQGGQQGSQQQSQPQRQETPQMANINATNPPPGPAYADVASNAHLRAGGMVGGIGRVQAAAAAAATTTT